jgi:hypothetical protein
MYFISLTCIVLSWIFTPCQIPVIRDSHAVSIPCTPICRRISSLLFIWQNYIFPLSTLDITNCVRFPFHCFPFPPVQTHWCLSLPSWIEGVEGGTPRSDTLWKHKLADAYSTCITASCSMWVTSAVAIVKPLVWGEVLRRGRSRSLDPQLGSLIKVLEF